MELEELCAECYGELELRAKATAPRLARLVLPRRGQGAPRCLFRHTTRLDQSPVEYANTLVVESEESPPHAPREVEERPTGRVLLNDSRATFAKAPATT
eukprot:scaffold152239_cov32-Tisochrysis_lutea.AAC.1